MHWRTLVLSLFPSCFLFFSLLVWRLEALHVLLFDLQPSDSSNLEDTSGKCFWRISCRRWQTQTCYPRFFQREAQQHEEGICFHSRRDVTLMEFFWKDVSASPSHLDCVKGSTQMPGLCYGPPFQLIDQLSLWPLWLQKQTVVGLYAWKCIFLYYVLTCLSIVIELIHFSLETFALHVCLTCII